MKSDGLSFQLWRNETEMSLRSQYASNFCRCLQIVKNERSVGCFDFYCRNIGTLAIVASRKINLPLSKHRPLRSMLVHASSTDCAPTSMTTEKFTLMHVLLFFAAGIIGPLPTPSVPNELSESPRALIWRPYNKIVLSHTRSGKFVRDKSPLRIDNPSASYEIATPSLLLCSRFWIF